MKFRIEIIGESREEETVAYVRAPGEFTERLEKFLSESEKGSGFTVYSEERDMFFTLSPQDVESISVIGTKTVVVDKDGREYTSKLRLYEAESRLPDTFLRINKSALINRNLTERFEASFGGGMRAVMKSGRSNDRRFPKLKKGKTAASVVKSKAKKQKNRKAYMTLWKWKQNKTQKEAKAFFRIFY